MILQALKEYYDRKAADPNSDIAPEGFEKKEIPFLILIKSDGEFMRLEDTREQAGQRWVGKPFLLPRSRTRTGKMSFKTTFLLWDHIGYLFGQQESGPLSAKQHQTWISFLEDLPVELKKDEGVRAVLSFYSNGGAQKVLKDPKWQECLRLLSCNMTFRLSGEIYPVPCRPAVQDYVRSTLLSGLPDDEIKQDDSKVMARCLVTGEYAEIARTHGRTPINKDTKSLVAFQKNSGYDSFGKEQCYNAPVCRSAEFAYVTGLNTLLKSRQQRMRVGDTTVVFWSAKDTSLEKDAFFFFSEPFKDNPDQNTESVRSVYESIWNGTYVIADDSTRFYVLGLAPSSVRIAIRFWHVSTVGEIGANFQKHVNDLAIIHSSFINPSLPLRRLLHSIAILEDDDNIPPNLIGETARSVLAGLPYPQTLLQGAIRRIRSEQARHDHRTGKQRPNVTYERAALIKACINRSTRYQYPNIKEELKVSLDYQNTNIGYRLGRLFASLEKIQQEASPGINATIRDKFYGSASSAPVTVFGTLMRLKNHHLAKLEYPARKVFFEKLLGEILGKINDFPPHLNLENQGRFAIGYYHQMQDFFTKKDKTE